MAGVCYGIVGETETETAVEVSSRVSRRRRLEVHQFKLRPAVDLPFAPLENERKRQKMEVASPESEDRCEAPAPVAEVEEKEEQAVMVQEYPKFGMTSVRGRRREMEDSVAIHPSFHRRDGPDASGLHFYGVYDGHGCSHVAVKCKDRMHEIVKEEIEIGDESAWKVAMEQSFARMDKEVTERRKGDVASSSTICKCELQTPQCDAVGSTAVVAVVSVRKLDLKH